MVAALRRVAAHCACKQAIATQVEAMLVVVARGVDDAPPCTALARIISQKPKSRIKMGTIQLMFKPQSTTIVSAPLEREARRS